MWEAELRSLRLQAVDLFAMGQSYASVVTHIKSGLDRMEAKLSVLLPACASADIAVREAIDARNKRKR
jgi:hypothetical protein